MEILNLIITIGVLAVWAWGCVYIAGQKNYNKTLAGVMGVLFGAFSMVVYLALNEKKENNSNGKQILTD